jgi:hypothetical protein
MTRFLVCLVLLFVSACVAPPRGGGVRPAPPGPFDAVRATWGDYSGMCPRHYDYCVAHRRSLCCPSGRGCCEDAAGPYCCASAQPPAGYYGQPEGYERDDDRDDRGSQYACDARDIMCSQGGRTVCCPRRSRCCADEDGPYCCGGDDRSRDRY